ncbi:nucleotide sugar dehydrogenase [Actinocatenispora thailandica]|uniref:Nucleotide sugar dehydrogenase n=1 Tax=Actinocatenispora thailandica TaxID=227318 RepID=A0A7R7DM62_9ACTN|nr:nucleotide sugar dehydrogenase [Actinocatenispora thailandica]BCJ34270.1 nucleotide sugar dehydrogenase [Actinocatenispora thailandica]
MAGLELALAVNGPLDDVRSRLIQGAAAAPDTEALSVGIVGLGYVGLPTALGLYARGVPGIGVDVSAERLAAIRTGAVDLPDDDRTTLSAALADGGLRLTRDPALLSDVDAVVVCVPTPVDRHRVPDTSALRAACAAVVEHARAGQTIVLTSTSYVGTTREMLIEPLRDRGLEVDRDVCVAFSPERIDPGVPAHRQRETPRLVGGETPRCAERAARLIGYLTDAVYTVSTPEAAELAKLYENVYRAVNLALANEIADICGNLALDPIEVTSAAATKPYGFLACFPGPGVGGHCIPCDPHYLLWQLRTSAHPAPLIEQAMTAIAARPRRVVTRAVELLAETGGALRGARILVIGVSYKPGVRDLRGSSAVEILAELARRGADVHYYDPLVAECVLPDGTRLRGERAPHGGDWDLALVHTVHPGVEYGWAADCPRVLDATYRFDVASHRQIV